jgi:hypothetical protein
MSSEDPVLTGLPALENTDWARLRHAYGRATDTPGYLRALLEQDPQLRRKAMSHLWSAVIHQGTPWTATGPAALVIAGLMFDERIDRGESIRAELLSFLVSVAEAPKQAGVHAEELERMAAFDIEPLLDSDDCEALYGSEDAGKSFYARSILGCITAAPVLMTVMLNGLSSGVPRVRTWAAMGAVTLAKIESLRNAAVGLEPRLRALAQTARDEDERRAHVLALGDLGCSPIAFLKDPSPAVRLCAALSPSLATDSGAISELLHALERHAGEIDNWFVERPPQFIMRPRFRVVTRLLEQVKDFGRLVNAAISVANVTEKYCVDFDWGPLLASAFSDRSGIIKTEAQRRFLCALVENRRLWDPRFGNPVKWFKKVGLPYDRKACAKIAKQM